MISGPAANVVQSDLNVDEKATTTQQKPVPGESPAYYVGDTSNDVLEIASLDLKPNPPIAPFTLSIQGNIKENIGIEPQLYVLAYLNGRPGPSLLNTLCPGRTKTTIIQNGEALDDEEVPTAGKVEIRYINTIPYTWLKKGWYTVRVETYASEEVGKKRMTAFEGGVWVEGGTGDGCGGWV